MTMPVDEHDDGFDISELFVEYTKNPLKALIKFNKDCNIMICCSEHFRFADSDFTKPHLERQNQFNIDVVVFQSKVQDHIQNDELHVDWNEIHGEFDKLKDTFDTLEHKHDLMCRRPIKRLRRCISDPAEVPSPDQRLSEPYMTILEDGAINLD